MSGMPPAPVLQSSTVASDGESSSRKDSFSNDSQTAADFIREQTKLEADAREALPYSIDNCTKALGALRQNVFACLTCNPPPKGPEENFTPAGVCYACSVQCHGEHQLVEIFSKRHFTCDCGTTRFPPASPCSLRLNAETNSRGGVHSEEPDPNNKYNQNFRNRFCACACDYDPFNQEGTMYQCLGLGTAETGGCGEDWYHPGCLVGLGPRWFEKTAMFGARKTSDIFGGSLPAIEEENEAPAADGSSGRENAEHQDDDIPPPPDFPNEDAFEGFICYKCVEAHSWIKRHAGTTGFLPPVYLGKSGVDQKEDLESKEKQAPGMEVAEAPETVNPKKRKADGEPEDASAELKRAKTEEPAYDSDSRPSSGSATDKAEASESAPAPCKLRSLPPAPEGKFSLFFTTSFRENLCHCIDCFPNLKPHEQLLEEEETYEPPLSSPSEGGSTGGSGSLYERGESALRNVDRVRAIEGVMAYNHLKDQLKPFFQKFAESGKAISAEDIKEYFAKLRGDEQAIRDASEHAQEGGEDNRREQSGY